MENWLEQSQTPLPAVACNKFRTYNRRGFFGRSAPPTLTSLVIVALLNLTLLAVVFLRRLVKHWYFLARDERRLQVAAYVAQALEQLRQGRDVAPPMYRGLAEEELLRRLPEANEEDRAMLRQLFRDWGLLADRQTRLRQARLGQRAYSALVLAQMEVHEALPDIVRLLEEGKGESRLAALRALDLLADPEATDALVGILPAVKQTAWRLVWSALTSCCRQQPERLLPHLVHPEPQVRTVVAAAIAEVARPEMVKHLKRFANDPEPEVRAKIVRALGRMGDSSVLPILMDRAHDPVWYVRLQAVEALGELGDSHAHETLALAIRDSHWRVRQKATTALYTLWRDPVALLELLRQGAPDRYALEALVSELERRGVTWEAINRVNSPLPTIREHSRELVRLLVEVRAYATVLYAIGMHPDIAIRQTLVELVTHSLPPEGHLDFVQVLASPYLDSATRRSIEKVVGFPEARQ